jgi:hypothetical protein
VKFFLRPYIWMALIGLFLGLSERAKAQDDGYTGGTLIVGTGGTDSEDDLVISKTTSGETYLIGSNQLLSPVDIVVFSLSPGFLNLNPLQVTPGSPLVLYVEFFGGGTAALHSFSLTYNNEPDLTLSSFTPTVPAGYSSSFANNTFAGQNVSGTDIPGSTTLIESVSGPTTVDTVTDLGTLTFTVNANTPVGTVLTLPYAATFNFLDASGNSLEAGSLQTNLGPTVVAPEPPTAAMISMGLLAFAILAWSSPRLGSARA